MTPDEIPLQNPEEQTDFLRRVPLFSDLDETALKDVTRKLKLVTLLKGAVLYREGDAGTAFYIMLSGRVRIVQEVPGGEDHVLNYMGRGETFGETALLTGAQRSVTVKADLPAKILALYKKDFDSFLKRTPSAALYLSQIVSQRLLLAARPHAVREIKSEMIGMLCDLNTEDQILYTVNLAFALTEQTRRKVLLLNFSEHGSDMVKSLGMKPVLTSSQMLNAEDLRNPRVMEKLTLMHPSGLEIMTLNPETFSGPLFRFIPALLSTLRETYDYTLVILKPGPIAETSLRAEIASSVLQDCDSVYFVSTGVSTHMDFLRRVYPQSEEPRDAQTFPTRKYRTILLQSSVADPSVSADFTVPWGPQVASNLRTIGRPYLTGPETEPTHRMLNRLARWIGHLTVGLACGSGAAYGYTLIGILKVFEREKIPIDMISGTSMGALIAAFYASGKTPAEIETIAYTITKLWMRHNFLNDLNLPWPHGGLLRGESISKFLQKHLGQKEFKDMVIPFGCVATDIVTGDAVVLREGKVWESVRASLSLPMIFRPFKKDSHFFVDGGLVNPVPASIISSLGANIVVSVNLTSKVSERKVSLRRLGMFPSKSPGFFDIFFKMIYTMQYQIASSRTDISQIVLRPDTHNFSWVDFHRAKQIIPFGEECAEEAVSKIKSRLPFFSEYCKVPFRRRPQ